MKKVYVLGALLILLLCAQTVRADVIIEPYGDSFYERHRSECLYINRGYIANGPDKAVTLYKAPDNDSAVGTVANGETVWILYEYTFEGHKWGVSDGYTSGGWMPMDYLYKVFDSGLFQDQYADVLQGESGSLDDYLTDTDADEIKVNCYLYPGAEDYFDITLYSERGYGPEYCRTFTDDQGRKWGLIGYFMGIRDRWICLDAPSALPEELYPNGCPTMDKREGISVDKPTEVIRPEADNTLIWCIVAVCAICMAGITLIVLMHRRAAAGAPEAGSAIGSAPDERLFAEPADDGADKSSDDTADK